MSDTPSSPGPWSVKNGSWIVDANGDGVADMYSDKRDLDKANAERIVLAVNHHDELIAELQRQSALAADSDPRLCALLAKVAAEEKEPTK